MLINISLEHIHISWNGFELQVERGDLEVKLPRILHMLYSEKKFGNQIYVINGPWSFTNLRIWCLCLNMLQSLLLATARLGFEEYHGDVSSIRLYTIDKMNLFRYLYKQSLIWPTGLMYIGQQKNAWRCDLSSWTYSKLSLDQAWAHDWTDIPTGLEDRWVLFGFWDNVLRVAIAWEIHFLDFVDCGWKEVNQLIPNYLMYPNIG